MAKMQSELLPSDRVMIEFGPRTQFDASSGETLTIEPAKQLDLPYSYFLEITGGEQGSDDYNPKTGYAKTLNRTVKLAGLTGYEEQLTDRGETVTVPSLVDFETESGRAAAKAKADADAKAKEKAEVDAKKAADAAAKAQAEFEAKERTAAEAEQQKRQVAASTAEAAATKPATEKPANAPAKPAQAVVDPNATANPELNK